jgi:hypothetical protein
MSLTSVQGGRSGNPPIPIPSATSKRTAFLEIVPHGDKLRVQRTEAGRALNNFWDVWLKQLMLDKTEPRDGVSIELPGNNVLIGSNLPRDGLISMVYGIAGLIRPLPAPPMKRRAISSSVEVWWEFTTDDDLTECFSVLDLPGPVRFQYGCSLRRGQKNPLGIGELARMVELHVALYYEK